MADLKISQLGQFSETDVVAGDVLPLADVSEQQTKKIAASDLVKAGARLNADTITFGNNVVVSGNFTVNGTTTTIDTTTLVVEDKNIEMGVVATPTDITANGGGITLKGTTDKTINWLDATDSWTSSENLDLASGKSYRINNVAVLSSTTLGSGVTGSSLTSVGTIGTGTWQGTAVGVLYGGTGQTSYTDGQLLIGNSTGNTLTKATLTAGAGVTITNGNGSITISAAGSGGTVTGVTGTAPIASSGGTAPDISLSLKANGGLVTETNALAVDLGASSITGTLGVADGGTGQTTYTDGQLLIGNSTGNTLTKATLTAGTGITITNGSGSISVAGTAASTSIAGVVQLTDSTSSTSTTTAATPNSVKSAYDLANAALPKAGGALTGDVTLNAQSDLRFADADSSNWVALQAPATISSNVTWTLPATDGTSGQVLSTNGTGTLSWATAGGSSFPAGTAMLFVQTNAPTGWTKSTTHNDKALRIVSGAASSGGTTAFTTVFASRTPSGTVGSTTLSQTQIPSHTHSYNITSTVVNRNTSGDAATAASTQNASTTGATGGGGSHDHSFTGTAMDFAVQYVDVIIATKD